MFESVGQRLRQRREARGQTLEAVSRATRLSRAVLIALEEERFDDLGARIYLRGHLRAYAQYLELNVDSLLERVESQLQQLPVAPDAPLPSALPRLAVPDYFRTEERPTRQISPASAVMLVATVLIVGVFMWSVKRKKQVQVATAPAPLSAPAVAGPAGVATPAAPVAAPLAAPAPTAGTAEMATGPAAPLPGKRLALPPLPGRDDARPLPR